jgi:hypothetical protein
MNYNICAITENGEVRGKVQSTKGKTAHLKMAQKLTGKVLYVLTCPPLTLILSRSSLVPLSLSLPPRYNY